MNLIELQFSNPLNLKIVRLVPSLLFFASRDLYFIFPVHIRNVRFVLGLIFACVFSFFINYYLIFSFGNQVFSFHSDSFFLYYNIFKYTSNMPNLITAFPCMPYCALMIFSCTISSSQHIFVKDTMTLANVSFLLPDDLDITKGVWFLFVDLLCVI